MDSTSVLSVTFAARKGTGGDADEESERGDASDAESVDPYDGWAPSECNSDGNTLRSDGHVSDPDMTDIDEDGNPIVDECGDPIVEEEPFLGDEGGYVSVGGVEPDWAYGADLPAAKRHKAAA